jgi:predicted DNA-binding ribbon-helix-helix protein
MLAVGRAPPPELIGVVHGRLQKSQNAKRSVVIGPHTTSVSIEDAFREIAATQNVRISDLLSTINTDRNNRQQCNLSPAIRLFVLEHYRALAEHRAGPLNALVMKQTFPRTAWDDPIERLTVAVHKSPVARAGVTAFRPHQEFERLVDNRPEFTHHARS